MDLNKIVQLVNKRLAGELFTYTELEAYLDDATDRINTRLNTVFPVPSEFTSATPGYPNYAFFPDRYIRSVLVPLAAAMFYSVDEEGASGAQDYRLEAEQNLFYMERDWTVNIPEEYQNTTHAGVATPSVYDQDRGVEVYESF